MNLAEHDLTVGSRDLIKRSSGHRRDALLKFLKGSDLCVDALAGEVFELCVVLVKTRSGSRGGLMGIVYLINVFVGNLEELLLRILLFGNGGRCGRHAGSNQ